MRTEAVSQHNRSMDRSWGILRGRSVPVAAIGAVTILPFYCGCTVTPGGDGGTSNARAHTATEAGTAARGDAEAAAAAASILGFTPSNLDPTVLDLTGLGEIDVSASDCLINSGFLDRSGCFDIAKVKFALVTQQDQVNIAVYVARNWRIEPNAHALLVERTGRQQGPAYLSRARCHCLLRRSIGRPLSWQRPGLLLREAEANDLPF